jgi:hypothetical protein
MDADKTVSATFNLAQVKNKTSGVNYATLGDALATVAAGNELLLQAMLYNGTISMNMGIKLNGGWDTVFGVRSGEPTMLNGNVTVQAGESTIDRVTVKGSFTITGGSLNVKDVVIES